MSQSKPAKSRSDHLPDSDSDANESALRSAMSATAMMAASDEEFAAGLPMTNPGAIIVRDQSAAKEDQDKPPESEAEKVKSVASAHRLKKKKAAASLKGGSKLNKKGKLRKKSRVKK